MVHFIIINRNLFTWVCRAVCHIQVDLELWL